MTFKTDISCVSYIISTQITQSYNMSNFYIRYTV